MTRCGSHRLQATQTKLVAALRARGATPPTEHVEWVDRQLSAREGRS